MKKRMLNSFSLSVILPSGFIAAAGRPAVDYALLRHSPRKSSAKTSKPE